MEYFAILTLQICLQQLKSFGGKYLQGLPSCMAAGQRVPGLLQVVRPPHPEQKTIMNLESKGRAENHVLFLLEGKEI